jgi:UDP-N-acetylmuramoylalanine--D-glutamate ligase
VAPGCLGFDDAGDDGERLLDGFSLPGAHNLQNLAAACLLALAGGLRRSHLHVEGLTGLPHRLEVARERSGVTWIDDSKATNVESALVALAAVERPVVALLGGQGKRGASYEPLVAPLRHARGVICFGMSGPEIVAVLETHGISCSVVTELSDAVEYAERTARSGDAVLLSPACASFDAFTDFEDRGRVFRTLVEAL